MKRFWPIIVLLLVISILFWPTLRKGYIPFSGNFQLAWYEPWKSEHIDNGVITIAHKPVVDDAFRHLYPLRVLAFDVIKLGAWPLWNPYNAAGTPLLAIFHPGFLNPFGFGFLWLPPHMAWAVFVVAQLVFLMLAQYWYIRVLRMGRFTALFSVLIFGLSGFVIVRIEYGEFLTVLGSLPLLLGIVEHMREHARSRWSVFIPMVVALLWVSGQPHMIIYVMGIFVLYALLRLGGLSRRALSLFGFTVLGIAISSLQLLPSLELFRQATIERGNSQFIFQTFLLPLWHLIAIAIPNYFGNQATYNYFGTGDYVETANYVGLIPLFFAIFAVVHFRFKETRVRFFVLVAGIASFMTLRSPFTEWFYTLPIPVISQDVPTRIFAVVTFCIAVVASFGFEAWQQTQKLARWTRFLWISLVLVGFLAIATFFAYKIQLPCPSEILHCRLVSLRNVSVEVGVFVALMFAFLCSRRVWHTRMRTSLIIFPILLVSILGLYNAFKFLPFSEKEAVFPKIGVIEALRTLTGNNRFFGFGEAAFRANLTTHSRLFSAEYFDPLHVRRFAELVSFANTGDLYSGVQRSDVRIIHTVNADLEFTRRRNRLLELLSVTHLVYANSEAPLGGSPIWQDAHWQIVVNTNPVPRVYIVNSYFVEQNDASLVNRLFDQHFDPHKTVLLEKDPVVSLGTIQAAAKMVRNTPNKLEITTAGDAGLLVLTDTYYPGWKAYVDNQETQIFRANYTFRAIVVPKGDHSVVFSYEPMSFTVGSVVTGISLVMYGIVCLLFIHAKKPYNNAKVRGM